MMTMSTVCWVCHALALGAMMLLACMSGVTAKSSRLYSMPGTSCSLIGHNFREIDGAAIVSSHKSSRKECVMNFEADSDGILSRNTFMVKFDRFNITDCETTLKLYYGITRTIPDVILDCRSPPPRAIYTQERYVTLVLDRGSDRGYDFQIILTSFRTTSRCTRLICRTDDDLKCLDRDLRCDRVANCENGYDEAGCVYSTVGASVKNIITAFIMLVVIIVSIGVLVVYCRRRHAARNLGYTTTTVAIPVDDQIGGQPMQMSMQPGGGAYPPAQPVYGSQAYPPYNANGPPQPPAYSGYPPQTGAPPPGYPPPGMYPPPAGYGAAVPPYGPPFAGAYPPAPPPGGAYPPPAPYAPPGSVGYTAGSDMVKMPPH